MSQTRICCQRCGFPVIYCACAPPAPNSEWERGAVPIEYPKPGWQAFEKFQDRKRPAKRHPDETTEAQGRNGTPGWQQTKRRA